MKGEPRTGRALKRTILNLLRAPDFDKSLAELMRFPLRQAVNPLLSFLLSSEEEVRWRAVVAIGALVENLADRDMESARVIMRRLMWSLNDESGGIGWGAPEVMGEIMARQEALANEYVDVLVSYCDEHGNYLEYEPLQRGLMWGVVRLAETRPGLLGDAIPHLRKYLESSDPEVRGLAALAVGLLGDRESGSKLQALAEDRAPVTVYMQDRFQSWSVGDLATRSLASLDA